MIKRAFAVIVTLLLIGTASIITFAGPWPAYGPGSYQDAGYYEHAKAVLSDSAARSETTDSPGALQVGWAVVDIVPTVPTGLGGFGARRGAMSTGTHDTINVKAIVISDGADTVALLGSDLMTVTPNVADLVRERVQTETGITPDRILFNASHTHSGPTGFIPGYIATLFGGAYVEGLAEFIAGRFSQAIIEAHGNMKPARIDSGTIKAPEFIKNRTRAGEIDSALDYLVFVQESDTDGNMCVVTRYSAHPTVIGPGNLEYSGDFPGYLQRGIEKRTGGTAIYLAGSVGSMGPRAPEAPDDFARAEAMGEGLAERVVEAIQSSIDLEDHADVAASGGRFQAPPLQARFFHPNWRLAPALVNQLGLTRDSWLQIVRIGDVVIAGTPADWSGEIAVELRAWGESHDVALWCTSFNGAYNGYISPDRYYGEFYEEDGDIAYETGAMSWAGPDQEAYYTSLIKLAVEGVTAP